MKLLFDELKSWNVKNFAGVKFTSFDLGELATLCAEYRDQYTICYGYDEVLSAITESFYCILTLYNTILIYIKLFDLANIGDSRRF